jgi:hypothetical protein
MQPRKFHIALATYALLAALAALTLDGHMRLIVWIVMAALGVKTWVAWKRG